MAKSTKTSWIEISRHKGMKDIKGRDKYDVKKMLELGWSEVKCDDGSLWGWRIKNPLQTKATTIDEAVEQLKTAYKYAVEVGKMSPADAAKLCTTNIRLIYNKPVRAAVTIQHGGRGLAWASMALGAIKLAVVELLMDKEETEQLVQFRKDWTAAKDDEERKALAKMILDEYASEDESEEDESEEDDAESSTDDE